MDVMAHIKLSTTTGRGNAQPYKRPLAGWAQRLSSQQLQLQDSLNRNAANSMPLGQSNARAALRLPRLKVERNPRASPAPGASRLAPQVR